MNQNLAQLQFNILIQVFQNSAESFQIAVCSIFIGREELELESSYLQSY